MNPKIVLFITSTDGLTLSHPHYEENVTAHSDLSRSNLAQILGRYEYRKTIFYLLGPTVQNLYTNLSLMLDYWLSLRNSPSDVGQYELLYSVFSKYST